VLAAVVVVAYARFFSVPPLNFAILETTLQHLTPELLAERQPILLRDRVARHSDLLRTALRMQHTWAGRESDAGPAEGPWRHCLARFTMLHAPDSSAAQHAADAVDAAPPSPVAVDIQHPDGTGGNVRVVLRDGQTLVMPPLWRYRRAPASPPLRQRPLHCIIASIITRLAYVWRLRSPRQLELGPH
jgi:hypothetical protein